MGDEARLITSKERSYFFGFPEIYAFVYVNVATVSILQLSSRFICLRWKLNVLACRAFLRRRVLRARAVAMARAMVTLWS